jgi:hypothetical protein
MRSELIQQLKRDIRNLEMLCETFPRHAESGLYPVIAPDLWRCQKQKVVEAIESLKEIVYEQAGEP